MKPNDPAARPRAAKANLRNVDLNLLVALDALLAEGSVTRAAEQLQCGQSAMSAMLARLRKLFGDPLFTRDGRGLAPTPFARSIAESVRDIVGRVDGLLSANTVFDPAVDQREFSITANDYVAAVLLRTLIARLATEAPRIRLTVESVHSDFEERLERGGTDLLILPKSVYPGHARYPHVPLFTDRYVCVVDDGNPDVGDALTVEQFSRQPYVAVHIGELPSSAERQLDSQGIARNVHVVIQAFTLAPSMLRGTRLMCLVQERLLAVSEMRAQLRVLEPPVSLCEISMIMLWDKRSAGDPGLAWLRGRIEQLAAQMHGTTHHPHR